MICTRYSRWAVRSSSQRATKAGLKFDSASFAHAAELSDRHDVLPVA
jgi:hypothetical protein